MSCKTFFSYGITSLAIKHQIYAFNFILVRFLEKPRNPQTSTEKMFKGKSHLGEQLVKKSSSRRVLRSVQKLSLLPGSRNK